MIGPAWLEGSGSVQQSRFCLATQGEPAKDLQTHCSHLTVGDVITVMLVHFCQESGGKPLFRRYTLRTVKISESRDCRQKQLCRSLGKVSTTVQGTVPTGTVGPA
jgi:hypothetical protein